ncbi:Pvc16 family protein [Actinomycetospora lutea]|uniref:Pvc16 family protein n=1 Tax=Actinomycetospora lutea TaxID=663604 RepID=UPI002367011F|nr:Pvc16 family protein [Actinomycetospora lutea]MDD7942422.1 Pvc16 family protein [Actinomycetospora lutea]
MSAHLAIPATTFVLRGIVQERVGLAYGTVLTAPTVSVEPPPRPAVTPAGGNGAQTQPEPPGLYLFLHSVSPNPALRNAWEPHLGPDGARTGRSPLALDLQYVLAATGADLEREALLGLGIVALTRFGVVPRPKITSILTAQVPPDPPQRLLDALPGEPLDQQLTQITVTQLPADVDLSTKLWSALQSPMRPAAHFLVTTVILDVEETIPAGPDVDRVVVGVRPDAHHDPTMPTHRATIGGVP